MIYLLEDDDSIRKLVVYALESQGYEAAGFSRPSEFRAAMRQRLPELVLMDIMLPEEDGISVLTRLRAEPETRGLPVIMLTAKNSEYDRAFGLDAGADDYISKPFGMMELLARVRAVLRRTAPQAAETEFRVGTLCVSPGKHLVTVDGAPVQLTYKEFLLLTCHDLTKMSGKVEAYELLYNIANEMGYNKDRFNALIEQYSRK